MSNKRTVIIGGPKTGKTTLALSLDHPHDMCVYHTDSLIHAYGWSEASDKCREWMETEGPWVIEGTIAVRGLRKFLGEHKEEKPCDEVIYLKYPYFNLTSQQQNMTNGIATIFSEIEWELSDLGVKITIDEGPGVL